jgi:S-DNA-T family DNA segregation ATPase FtsK/SpoIIIE
VRILAPIPGKAAVGVEVPNQKPTPVGMRELLESEDWSGLKAEIPIALGKDVSGEPLISDLSKMPHLLIAGATGSGKSVCINSIVASILYSKSPKDLRLIMVDPKVVELKVFNALPHMLIPVVTEPKKVPAALKWLLGEMEQRYQIFAKANVRNIVGFNGRKRGVKPETPPEAQPALPGVADDDIEIPDRLPYIVAIIDELADLMMVAPGEVEDAIIRIAQKARAVGIHLLLATQRPSVDVITGMIKANVPSRIAFAVSSQVDSRVVLDSGGAESLLGNGDMLFRPVGTSRLQRLQGAYVSEEEILAITDYWRRQGRPEMREDLMERPEQDEPEVDAGGDEMLQKAVETVVMQGTASVSLLQRRLGVGYARAGRLVDSLERLGVISGHEGSKPRTVLIGEGDIPRVLGIAAVDADVSADE